jgi:hypothetical protein
MVAIVSDQPTTCPICVGPGKILCEGCRDIKYCSEQCKEAEAHSHRLPCMDFKNLGPSPGPDFARIIAFSGSRPAFKYCNVKPSTEKDDPKPDLQDFLGDDCDSENIIKVAFDQNPITHQSLGYKIWLCRKKGPG